MGELFTMHSLRSRFTLLTIAVVMLAVASISLTSILFVRSNEHDKADQLLMLLCETGQRNLNNYFDGVQKSVQKMESFAESNLHEINDKSLEENMDKVRKYFDEVASKTNGVLTYYYRIDPDVSKTVKGFWYTNLTGDGFVEHKVTDITLYNTEDTSQLVWFTVPKHEDKAIWIAPYITDNLNVRVISYNVPIHCQGKFVGVIGIEIDYTTMAEQVNNIRLYSNGYAFLNDNEGKLFYHPRIDVTKKASPDIPKGVVTENSFFRYTFEENGKAVEKDGAWLPLSNGMRINVVVPVSELEGSWEQLFVGISVVSLSVLIVACIFTMFYTRRIAKPLKQLTEAAEQVDRGNYNYKLTYEGDDEVGRLTRTFKHLVDDLKKHIGDLNTKVFTDALTKIKNKAAFTAACNEIQAQIDSGEVVQPFAVGVFDCNNLKYVNDIFGHEKGDIYLRNASNTICNVFLHSPVFRIGGDEFAVILRNFDYEGREVLINQLETNIVEINASTKNKWEKVDIAYGITAFDEHSDRYVNDVVRRADKLMYDHKQKIKAAQGKPKQEEKV